jgi:putative membrane protein
MNWSEHFKLGFKGMLMGAADVIPGVSGGTIAFITGIYQKLIDGINSINIKVLKLFLKGEFKKSFSKIHWSTLIPIFVGILISVFSLAKIITSLLENYPIQVWSFFFGLILSSIFIVAKAVKEWNPKTIAGLILGAVGAYFVVGMIPVSTPKTHLFTFISGCIAIVAMILPGLSGSFILVLLSQYRRILEAVKSFQITTMLVFAMGCGVGLISFSRLLGYLLKKHYSITMAVLAGFMLGSLRKVWPYKKILSSSQIGKKTIVLESKNIVPPNFDKTFALGVLFLVLGILLIIFIEFLASRKKGDENVK